MDKKELATIIEQAWMSYNAACVSRFHPDKAKAYLANIMINNANDIIAALNTYVEPVLTTADVITGDDTVQPKKVKK